MNLTFPELKCPCCEESMYSAGGTFGGRITTVKFRCGNCNTGLLIVPMSKELEYSISATTKEERMEKKIQEAKDRAALKLAEEITKIQSQYKNE